MSAATSWEAALDALEARLDEIDPVSHAGVKGFAFVAPAVEGTLPPSLVPRAQALIDRSDALRHDLEQEAAEIRATLRKLPRIPRARKVGRRLDIGA